MIWMLLFCLGSVQRTHIACDVAGAAKITKARAKVDRVLEKCSDTSGLAGCRFEMMADPECLGTSALDIGDTLINSVFGLDP